MILKKAFPQPGDFYNIIRLLKLDFKLYRDPDGRIGISPDFFRLFLFAIVSRDFRLNVLVRLRCARILIISRLCESLIFYLYSSSISGRATIAIPLRFCHAHSIVIGKRVRFETGDYAYIFNNVTIGKALPGDPSGEMPTFKGSVIIGVGSVILGSVITEGSVIFGANSFCANKVIPAGTTVVGANRIISKSYNIPSTPFQIARASLTWR